MTRHRASSSTPFFDEQIDEQMGEDQHPLTEAGQEAGESVGRIAERATELGFRQADRGREQTAEGLDQLAGSMRRVSTDVQSEQPAIANVALTAADQTEQIARFLRDTDARQLVSTIEDAARRQPLLFLGGAFLLGLAASRLLKAGGGTAASSEVASRARDDYRAVGPARSEPLTSEVL